MFLLPVCLLPLAMGVIMEASTQTTQTPEAVWTCNSCCQGPVGPQGNPGIPGVGIPGSHGLPGSIGPKGDPGLSIKGDVGECGSRGEPGEKGERGYNGPRGLPGKVGPTGMRGLTGERGLQGDRGLGGTKGEQGLPGSKGDQGVNAVTRQSAFTVVKTNTQTTSGVITFGNVITNIGDDFDTSSNKFTCRVPGVYVFMFNINTDHLDYDTTVHLKKNTQSIVGAVRDHQMDYRDQDNGVSGSAVLSLVSGDQVWLHLLGGEADHEDYGTNFSGFLLYEN